MNIANSCTNDSCTTRLIVPLESYYLKKKFSLTTREDGIDNSCAHSLSDEEYGMWGVRCEETLNQMPEPGKSSWVPSAGFLTLGKNSEVRRHTLWDTVISRAHGKPASTCPPRCKHCPERAPPWFIQKYSGPTGSTALPFSYVWGFPSILGSSSISSQAINPAITSVCGSLPRSAPWEREWCLGNAQDHVSRGPNSGTLAAVISKHAHDEICSKCVSPLFSCYFVSIFFIFTNDL